MGIPRPGRGPALLELGRPPTSRVSPVTSVLGLQRRQNLSRSKLPGRGKPIRPVADVAGRIAKGRRTEWLLVNPSF